MEPNPDIENISDLVFFTNRALQGEIRPNMRKIAVEFCKDEKRFILYLYYDKPLSEDEKNYDVPGTIIAELSSNFPYPIDIEWEDKIVILPYPSKLPSVGICVYCRYEPSPPSEE